jgi:hypothetical protein
MHSGSATYSPHFSRPSGCSFWIQSLDDVALFGRISTYKDNFKVTVQYLCADLKGEGSEPYHLSLTLLLHIFGKDLERKSCIIHNVYLLSLLCHTAPPPTQQGTLNRSFHEIKEIAEREGGA